MLTYLPLIIAFDVRMRFCVYIRVKDGVERYAVMTTNEPELKFFVRSIEESFNTINELVHYYKTNSVSRRSDAVFLKYPHPSEPVSQRPRNPVVRYPLLRRASVFLQITKATPTHRIKSCHYPP